MRDLSKSFSANRGSNRNYFLRIGILVLAVGAVIFLAKNLLGGGIYTAGAGAVTLKDAPLGLVPVALGDTTFAAGGTNLATQSITLTDVKYGGDAKGTARRSYGAGVYKLDVSATLPDPKNVAYVVWLVGESGTRLVDVMSGSKNSWSLSLSDTDKYSGYSGIWITLERDKADSIVEEHVMEGSF